MMTLQEKRMVGRYLRKEFAGRNPKRVRFEEDQSVTVYVDPMPNTNQAGRIFVGWDTELLAAARG